MKHGKLTYLGSSSGLRTGVPPGERWTERNLMAPEVSSFNTCAISAGFSLSGVEELDPVRPCNRHSEWGTTLFRIKVKA